MMYHIRGYWIFATVFIGVYIIALSSMITECCFKNVDHGCVECHKCFSGLFMLAHLISAILETVAFAKLSDYFGRDHLEPLRSLDVYEECSSPTFALAL